MGPAATTPEVLKALAFTVRRTDDLLLSHWFIRLGTALSLTTLARAVVARCSRVVRHLVQALFRVGLKRIRQRLPEYFPLVRVGIRFFDDGGHIVAKTIEQLAQWNPDEA